MWHQEGSQGSPDVLFATFLTLIDNKSARCQWLITSKFVHNITRTIINQLTNCLYGKDFPEKTRDIAHGVVRDSCIIRAGIRPDKCDR